MKFAGCLCVGARVADTMRTKVVINSLFEGNSAPAYARYGVRCHRPTSLLDHGDTARLPRIDNTLPIMDGIIGMGIAAVYKNGVHWISDHPGTGKICSGVIQISLAWIIALGLGGCFGAIILLVTKYAVMLLKNVARKAFCLLPVYFAATAMLFCMLLI